MPSTTNQTTIVNRGLQILGQKRVGSIQDNDRGARAMNAAYLPVLQAMLRENYWNFALKRISLVANAIPPPFGFNFSYQLPSDFLDLAPSDDYSSYTLGANYGNTRYAPSNDYTIEGTSILSNQQSPLQIRYVSSNLLESTFDACFAEAFSARLAIACCEELTQSNSKMQAASAIYDKQMDMAKSRGAFESRSAASPVDSWILARF